MRRQRPARLRTYALALERTLGLMDQVTTKAKKLVAEVAWLKHAADWLDATVDASWPAVDGASTPYWWF
jgi:hypothetical protein